MKNVFIHSTKQMALWLFYFSRYSVRQFYQQRGLQIASSLAYTTLLSLGPLVTVAFVFMENLPMFQDVGTAIKEFVFENYGQKFHLPGRGPIGANCMANPRDFKTPVAAFEDRDAPSTVTVKWAGQFHETKIDHSPLDVVAWHGNYAPCKYDLRTYCPVGSILFDHPDPSIFTVLTAPSGVEGTANIDFVLFRDRWMVAEDTFRPPWYHKNVMSELMGNIYGIYDAKPKGFVPGGMSLHNMMLPHGPDKNAFEGASNADLKPEYLANTMSFMFETRFPQHLTAYAATEMPLQDDYIDCWSDIEKKFDGTPGIK